MPVVKYLNKSYSCTTAIKGSNFIELRDEAGYAFCRFDGINNFSLFTIDDGAWTDPTAATEIMADTANLANGRIVLTTTSDVATGTTIKFVAPCDCAAVYNGLTVNGSNYLIVDANGDSIAGASGYWAPGAVIAVIIDAGTKRAFVQNAANRVSPDNIKEPVPISKGGTGATTAAGAADALGVAKIFAGSYVGTGNSNRVVLRPGFPAKLINIVSEFDEGIATIYPQAGFGIFESEDERNSVNNARFDVTVGSDNSVSFAGYTAIGTFIIVLNYTGQRYYYTIFG